MWYDNFLETTPDKPVTPELALLQDIIDDFIEQGHELASGEYECCVYGISCSEKGQQSDVV